MRRRNIVLIVCAAIGLAIATANSPRLSAQDQSGFAGNKVTPLVKVDLTGVSNKQVIANIYEVPPKQGKRSMSVRQNTLVSDEGTKTIPKSKYA